MFACIYFKEDCSLGVVAKTDKKLKVLTEFDAKHKVEMHWKVGGKLELYHGEIIKIHDNEEIINKYATRADNIVIKEIKRKNKPQDDTPDKLFEIPLIEEKVGKRKPKPTEKIQESSEQDQEFSPKKKKTTNDSKKKGDGAKEGNSKTKIPQKKEANPKALEKKSETETSLLVDIEMSTMLDQLLPPGSSSGANPPQPPAPAEPSVQTFSNKEDKMCTPLTETWSLCNDQEKSNKIPVPSAEVLLFLQGFSKPGVLDYMKKIAEHFADSSCSHTDDECFEKPKPQTPDLMDISSFHQPYQYTCTHFDQTYTSTCSSNNFNDQIQDNLPIITYERQQKYPLHQSPYTSDQPTTHDMSTPQTMSPFILQQSTPITPNVPSTSQQPKDQPAVVDGMASPSPICQPLRRSPRKSLQYERNEDQDKPQDVLLKLYPDVKIQPEKLASSISAATKANNKPGYTLCYNLIVGVFSLEELASSRGQGIMKRKEGDLRPVLNKNKCSAVKEYTRRWCKHNEKAIPSDAELNNAFSEQCSNCRKKLKKMLKN